VEHAAPSARTSKRSRSARVPFYGPAPDTDDLSDSRRFGAPFLSVPAGQDGTVSVMTGTACILFRCRVQRWWLWRGRRTGRVGWAGTILSFPLPWAWR